MQFLNRTDLLSLIDEATLTTISDNNTVYIDESEARAIDEMTAYINSRYDILKVFDTEQPRNNLVVMYLCDILLYHLHARIMPDNIPELRVKRYDTAIQWLDKVADGFITPMLPKNEDPTKTQIRSGNSSEKQDQYY